VANLGLGPVRLGLQAWWTVVFLFLSVYFCKKNRNKTKSFLCKIFGKKIQSVPRTKRKKVRFIYLEAIEFMIKLF
jgi:hypothetical protein